MATSAIQATRMEEVAAQLPDGAVSCFLLHARRDVS